MDEWRKWSLTWRARKLGVSAFLVVHLGATLVWVLPACPVRRACVGVASYYILPLGLWQFWAMFAPDPMRETVTLEADVVDARGLRATFAFPKIANDPFWVAAPRFRHPKYAANLFGPDSQIDRELAAHHAVRRLGVPDAAFPVDVHLIYQVRPSPPPGGPPADPMKPTEPFVIGTFHFSTPGEVRR